MNRIDLLEFLCHYEWRTPLEVIAFAKSKGKRLSRSFSYCHLNWLEGDGFVEGRERDGRVREYLLTEHGFRSRHLRREKVETSRANNGPLITVAHFPLETPHNQW